MAQDSLNSTPVAATPPLGQNGLTPRESNTSGAGETIAEATMETTPNGVEKHYLNGVLHREDGPAILHPGGGESWWRNGKLHREGDLPAMTTPNGTRCWYKEGKLHRGGGKPAVILPGGEKEYWVEGSVVTPEKKRTKRRIIME